MTTANEAYRKAANSPAGRHASETAKSAGETVKSAAETARSMGEEFGEQASDFASDVSRKAAKQFRRAQDVGADVYDELHEASVRNPHITLLLGLGFGFLIGAFLMGRR
jgi:hypothetical protein